MIWRYSSGLLPILYCTRQIGLIVNNNVPDLSERKIWHRLSFYIKNLYGWYSVWCFPCWLSVQMSSTLTYGRARGICTLLYFCLLCSGYINCFNEPIWTICTYSAGLLHWQGVPVKQPWIVWINKSRGFTKGYHSTTTKQSTTKTCINFRTFCIYQHGLVSRCWCLCLVALLIKFSHGMWSLSRFSLSGGPFDFMNIFMTFYL